MCKSKRFLLFILSFYLILSLKAQELYVGANYHPHDDKNIEKIRRDIQPMKDAGFTVVRMGHLAWDSYDPSEGKFDFAWFDGKMQNINFYRSFKYATVILNNRNYLNEKKDINKRNGSNIAFVMVIPCIGK